MLSDNPSSQSSKPAPDSRPWSLAKRLTGRWGRQALLNVGLVCLAAGAVCGKQLLIRFSLFTSGICQTSSARNFKLTDIYMTGTGLAAGLVTMKVEWDGDPGATFSVLRNSGPLPGGNNDANGHGIEFDTFAAQSGTQYVYSVQQQDLPSYTYGCSSFAASTPVTINVTPLKATVTDNQTVDARYDPRYALWTYLNHNFGTSTYRGGLYVGFNGDSSEVGHSYLNFMLPAVPSGQHLWQGVGSVNAQYRRSYVAGSTVVACQSVPTTWSGPTITWSTAPAFTPGNATAAQQATVTYDGSTPPFAWTHWKMSADIATALTGGGAYAAALGGYSEPSTASAPIGGAATGWAYFSKKESPSGQAAVVLYAYGSPN